MVAAGLYDGSVAVYNLQVGGALPVHQCSALTGKHSDTVWQVRWAQDDLDSYLNFFSVSEVMQSHTVQDIDNVMMVFRTAESHSGPW